MKKITLTEMSIEDFQEIIESVVQKQVSNLLKRRTKPYTRKEVLELFQVTPPTITSWEKKGFLERTQVEGRVYYSAESVQKYLDER